MANVEHSNLTGSAAVHPAAYVSSSDPGAVGTDKLWVDTSAGQPYQLKRRDATNTGWELIGLGGTALTNPTTTRGDLIRRGASTLDRLAIGATGTLLRSDGTDPSWSNTVAHLAVSGLTGATTATRYVGGTTSGSPASGTFSTGDWIVAQDGSVWVCTASGSPGTWAEVSGSGGGGGSSSGGGVGSPGALAPLHVIGPLTADQASVTLTPPTTGYKNLRIVWDARASAASGNEGLLLRLNSDSSASYDRVVEDTGGTSAATAQTSVHCGYVANASHATGTSSAGEIVIPDYLNTTFWKNVYSRARIQSLNRGDRSSGTWKSTAAVTSITLIPQTSAAFTTGSYFCLYGESDTASVLLTPASNLLYETTLTAAAASIDTGTLSQAYKDLRVEISELRGSTAATEVGFLLRFNGDTASNYDWSRVSNSNATVTGQEGTATTSIQTLTTTAGVTADSSTANASTSMVIDVPGYTGTTRWKAASIVSSESMGSGAGNRRATLSMGTWRSTAAITSLQITLSSGNIMAGTSVRVYGTPISAAGASVGTGARLRISANQSIANDTDALVTWDTEDSDADNQHYTSAASLTGTVDKTAASATLAGTGTAFTTELSVGQVISVPGTAAEKRVVTAIASNTSLTVNAAFANTATGQTGTRLNTAVVFRQPGFYALAAGAYWASSATGYRRVGFILNDTTEIGQDSANSIGALAMGQTASIAYKFSQWDFVEVRVRQTSGGALDLTADQRTYLSVSARPTVTVAVPYVNIQDQKTSGTASGSFTSGAWQTRTLNTVHADSGSIATLSSNQITLPAGTYRVRFVAAGAAVDRHQTRVQNVTDATTLALGVNAFAPASGTHSNTSNGSGRFTISAPKLIELQHRCQTTRATDGYGFAASWGTEVYAVVEFWKES